MKVLKSLLIAAFVFAGCGLYAQSATQWDAISPKSYDQDKQHAMSNPKMQNVHPDVLAKLQLQEDKMVDAMKNDGYFPVPGFTYTGVPATDKVNFAVALDDYKQRNPAGYWSTLQAHGH
jgi:PBP1b-binding outer membrane lipoprotein LpoB